MENIFGTNKRIRLGIWGLGRGSSFVKAAKELNIDVVAGCDFNPLMRDEFAKNCPDAFVTSDDKEFLAYKDMDAVLIATFFAGHAEHTIRALEAGFHVMCEVTSFFTPAEGVRVVEAVEKSGKIYHLLENYPFTKESMYLADLWKKGFFGEFMYGEFHYLHDCRSLCYGYNMPGCPPVEPGYQAHHWRSWLNFHYYNTHSLGPVMKITGLRPEKITAFPNAVPLPGYLDDGAMGKACASLIQMSNGGVFRNLTGATTGDNHMGKRLWGTRASAESERHGLYLRIGAGGHTPQVAVEPQWPELGELADSCGHGGGDFWELYYFAREVLTGEPGPWGIYAACDVTLAGIMAVRSSQNGGIPVEIPDFRNKEVREKYRNDNFAQEHFDPAAIFPADCDKTLAGRFNSVMLKLIRNAQILRAAFDGSVIWNELRDDAARLAVLKSVTQAEGLLPEFFSAREEAEELLAAYPESLAAKPLGEMLALQMPELGASEENLREQLTKIKEKMTK